MLALALAWQHEKVQPRIVEIDKVATYCMTAAVLTFRWPPDTELLYKTGPQECRKQLNPFHFNLDFIFVL